MNKKLFFALAATVGLFASCSSDDIVSESPARQAAFNDNGSAKIEFGIATAEVTRGTGAVGVDGGTGLTQWEGQEFSVLMLEKGTTLGAYADEERTTPIIKGALQRATGTGVASIDDDAVYYPTYLDEQGNQKVYDFWAYRLDDAAATPVYNGYDDAEATQVTIPFAINGTQDLMYAETVPSAAYDAQYLYSAKSARNAIKPTFAFHHLLTQLRFKVKAMDQAMTTLAVNPTTDPLFVPGYEIKDIIVKSASTGQLIAAYTTEDAPAQRIIWDDGQDWAAPATLADFHLQTRQRDIDEAADIKMVSISTGALAGFTRNFTADYEDEAGNTSYTVDANFDALVVYDSDALDAETGLPTGALTTIGALKAANPGVNVEGFILTYRVANPALHTDGVTAWNVPQYAAAAAGVTSDLVPFENNNTNPAAATLTWDAVAGAGNAIAVGEPMIVAPADANGYTITVKYAYWKKASASSVVYTTDFSNTIHLKNQTTGISGAPSINPFDAGKRYTVTLKLYPNGEVSQGTTTLDPWEDGGELEGNDNE